MLKSNINITSNIYIRKFPEDLRKDTEYIQKITGARIIREIQKRYSGFEALPLTEVQRRIALESTPCAYARNGEKSFGAVMVDGVMKWENRCENTECRLYADCVAKRRLKEISRTSAPLLEEDDEEERKLQDFFASIGILFQKDEVTFEHDKSPVKENELEEQISEYTAPPEEPVSHAVSKDILISSPECIIHSPLKSHILLNSGPGTGKTYTIIQRLIYILENALCPAEEIYILCYTRSAKKVIESKIDEAVMKNQLRPSAKNICVLTFDSYATFFLMSMKEQGVITEDFSGYGYNARIALFNKYIGEENFEFVSYFIVDEIQDLVNERAEMVLHILKHLTNLNCGYLLAGDRCQSIYDYEADKEANIDSREFYHRMEAIFPEDILRYEIVSNRRQCPELANEANQMRKVLLSKSCKEQNEYANEVIRRYTQNIKIHQYIQTLEHAPSVPTAILCRSNGDAEYISGLLCRKKIPHFLNRGVNHASFLPRWIADIFWDYCDSTISKMNFTERFTLRSHFPANPEKIWNDFCKMTKSENQTVLEMSKLVNALTVINNIPNDFYEDAPLLTVSTIHKAKGSEFDRVILLESTVSPSTISAEGARIQYVAITRPKQQLVVMKKKSKYFRKIESGRTIETGLHNLYKSKYKFCKCITVGLTGDIDNTSFVSGDFESVVDLQEYIAHEVHLYDELTAERLLGKRKFQILHNGKCIGFLSEKMFSEISNGISATDYSYNLPLQLENLYVSHITAEVLRKFNDTVPTEFQKSRICFGIQITGLAGLNFRKR